MLAELAVADAPAFTALVEVARKNLPEETGASSAAA
jgi:ribosomal protein L20